MCFRVSLELSTACLSLSLSLTVASRAFCFVSCGALFTKKAADRELLAVTETLEKERQVCMNAAELATQAKAEAEGNMETLKQEHERVKQDYKSLLGETADLQHERRSLQEQLDDALNSMSSLSLSSGLTRRQGTKSGPIPASKQVKLMTSQT